jgi:adenosylcobinamide-GDP ribazoletransferase
MKSLRFAFMFFTRLPLGREIGWDSQTAARSLSFLPLTGAVLGLLLSLTYQIMQYFGWPQTLFLQISILLLVELGFGGFLFIDGFADSCDGLFSQADQEKTFRIMKDSRLGTLGVLGLILLYVIKISVLMELYICQDFWRVLLFYPCWSRWCVSSALHWFKAAKPEGLAAFFKEADSGKAWLIGTAFTIILSWFLSPVWLSLPLSALVVGLAACRIQKKLGGHTGDTYGFLCYIGELSLLLFISILRI